MWTKPHKQTIKKQKQLKLYKFECKLLKIIAAIIIILMLVVVYDNIRASIIVEVKKLSYPCNRPWRPIGL
jgi:cell division protein FtsL